jgi:hypothetical protein
LTFKSTKCSIIQRRRVSLGQAKRQAPVALPFNHYQKSCYVLWLSYMVHFELEFTSYRPRRIVKKVYSKRKQSTAIEIKGKDYPRRS